MRKITNEIASALRNNVSKTIDNTRCDGRSVWLHGNLIARFAITPGITAKSGLDIRLEVSLAGWPTVTTRERLNGILAEFGSPKRFRQSRGNQFFGDRCVSANEWVTV